MASFTRTNVHSVVSIALALTAIGGSRAVAGGECDPSWIPTYGSELGPAGTPWAFTVFDDGGGAGPTVYAGLGDNVVRWNGAAWVGVGSGGFDLGPVRALAVFDDGGGPALYAGGDFQDAEGNELNNIAKWNGSQWTSLDGGVIGGGFLGSFVFALLVYDDGGGPALYAGGNFTLAGRTPESGVARWDGTSWSAVGNTLADVRALAVYDSGTGPALHAGTATGLKRWDGATWTQVGVSQVVHSLAVYDDGSGAGETLYVGTSTTIQRWDGSVWTTPGGGVNNDVRILMVHDDGTGACLYAGGDFTLAGGSPASRIAKWDGAAWSSLGSGTNSVVRALITHDDGSGPALLAGGNFATAGGIEVGNVARWADASWSALGEESGISDDVLALETYDDGFGTDLYAGGLFVEADGSTVNRIARWDGSSWAALDSGVTGAFTDKSVYALEVFDDGNGAELYVGGAFTAAGAVATNRIGRWDGSSWSAVAGGINGAVRALLAYDFGSGPALYAGGSFTEASGVSASRTARWNGSSWSALGSGLNGTVHALAAYDDGSGGGPQLYAGGSFTMSGAVSVTRIARWDGTSWHPLGSGLSGDIFGNFVYALASYDDGSGPALYAGGQFQQYGAFNIARWDGTSWSPIEDVGGSGTDAAVRALTVFDDGSGPALYMGGEFNSAGVVFGSEEGFPANVARYDGSSWSALDTGMDGDILALATGGGGCAEPVLYVGGSFQISPGGDRHVARWGCIDESIAADITGDGCVGFADMVEILIHWGACPEPCESATCPWDLDGNCDVGFGDITEVLIAWD